MNIQIVNNSPLSLELMEKMKDKVKSLDNQLDLPVTHHRVEGSKDHVCNGVYARELFIPAGTVAVGAIHKYPQLNIMASGVVDIATTEGIFRIKAPYTTVAPAGVQRVVYAIEDTVWITIHGIDEEDPEQIEKMVVCDTPDKYLQFKEQQLLEVKE